MSQVVYPEQGSSAVSGMGDSSDIERQRMIAATDDIAVLTPVR